ncbi:MAG: hypothetical protein FH749_09940 [Firmicutes bacterium]|nr:hypothetical protein [Bacillota bacterium]
MNKGICPKCNSTEVYSSETLRYKAGTYSSNTIPLSLFRSIPLDNYVCVECGYTESYIADAEMMPRIRNTWKRVMPETEQTER